MKDNGIMALFIENVAYGRYNEAKNGNLKLFNIYMLEFQAIKNTPNESPIIKKLQKFISPMYSGSKNKYSNP